MKMHFFSHTWVAVLVMSCASIGAPDSSTANITDSKTSNPSKSTGANNAKVSSIEGNEWKLIEVYVNGKNTRFDRKNLPEAMANFFTLKFDGQNISGVGAPNRYSASYNHSKNQTLNIKIMIATKMATLIELKNLDENEYFIYMQNASSWKLVRNKLELLSKTKEGGEVKLVFSL